MRTLLKSPRTSRANSLSSRPRTSHRANVANLGPKATALAAKSVPVVKTVQKALLPKKAASLASLATVNAANPVNRAPKVPLARAANRVNHVPKVIVRVRKVTAPVVKIVRVAKIARVSKLNPSSSPCRHRLVSGLR